MRESIRFLLQLYRAQCRYAPAHMAMVVLCKLLSLLALLTSLILPWQLLVAMDGRVPARLAWLPTEHLVQWLGAAIAVAFVVHLVCEWAIGWAARAGAARILLIHDKTGLFSLYRERASGYFEGMSRAMGTVVLTVLVMAALLWLYPALAVCLACYASAWLGGWVAVGRWRPQWRQRWRSGRIVKFGWYLGTVFVLAWVVATYTWVSTPPLLILFACVLGARQVLIQSFQAAAVWRRVARQRQQADLLFQPDVVGGRAAAGRTPSEYEARLAALAAPSPWLSSLMQRLDEPGQPGEPVCTLVEQGRVAYLTVPLLRPQGMADSGEAAWLLKLSSRARVSVAEHEHSLLREAQRGWPAPRLLHAESDDALACSVFAWRGSHVWLGAEERRRQLVALRQQLLVCMPSDALLARYRRSHLPLADRWRDAVDWQRLAGLLGDPQVADALTRLCDRDDEIRSRLAGLPGQIVLPELAMRRMALAADGALLLCNWTHWRWDPVGAGWPGDVRSERLDEALTAAARQRPALGSVDVRDAHLAAALASLLSAGRRQALGQVAQAVGWATRWL